jgi:hypothetical protein
MDEILTIAEIEGRFDSEWVLIEDPSTDEFLDVRGGMGWTRWLRQSVNPQTAVR